MKRKYYRPFVTFLFLASFVFCFAQKTLTILHTNDLHSSILPMSEHLADTMVAGRGGLIRHISMLEQERTKDPELLLFDSGDFSQGSPYYTLFKGEVEVGLMNRMKYDAGTLGNHEFDFGLENLKQVLEKLNHPIVCSNYVFPDTSALKKLVHPYLILKRKGLKIGIMGLSPKPEGLIQKDHYGDMQFLDPVTTAQRMADMLKAKKCDVVICISHLGWGNSTLNDQNVIRSTRGIDLVLGGHSHTFFETLRFVDNAVQKRVPVDQNGKSGLFVGKILLHLKKK